MQNAGEDQKLIYHSAAIFRLRCGELALIAFIENALSPKLRFPLWPSALRL